MASWNAADRGLRWSNSSRSATASHSGSAHVLISICPAAIQRVTRYAVCAVTPSAASAALRVLDFGPGRSAASSRVWTIGLERYTF